jgi:5-methylcytosine-specific restriction endonuclease McrA
VKINWGTHRSPPYSRRYHLARMRQHIVIRKDTEITGTKGAPQIGVFTQTHARHRPVPWGRIDAGEPLWMKWSGGPIVAKASVSGLWQRMPCTKSELRATTEGTRLYNDARYWAGVAETLAAGMTIYLRDEEWLQEPFMPHARSRGSGWIVLDSPEQLQEWLIPSAEPYIDMAPRERTGPSSAKRTITPSQRFKLFHRDNFRCTYCGASPVKDPDVILEVDHVIPWSRGGTTTLDNLRTACKDCNRGKSARSL